MIEAKSVFVDAGDEVIEVKPFSNNFDYEKSALFPVGTLQVNNDVSY